MYKTVEVFPSMKSFLKANRERDFNIIFRELGKSPVGGTQDINRDDRDSQGGFTGTKNYKEAESLALKGWVPSNARNNNIFKANSKSKKMVRRTMTGPVGYAPHVPNAIAGRPDSMIYQKRIIEQQPSINILVNFSISANLTKEQIEQTSINLFSALQDTKINLCVGGFSKLFKSKRNREIMAQAILVIKLTNESMAQRFFAVAHPAMLRRLFFRWLETVPGLKHQRFTSSYGHVGSFTQSDLQELGLKEYKICNVKDFIGLDKDEILAKLKKL